LYIEIDPRHDPASPLHEARLRGPVSGLAAALCGLYPLHSAGLMMRNGLLGISARSGTGKSTLTALAADRGVPVSGDDLLILRPNGDVLSLEGMLRIEPASAPRGWTPSAITPDGRGWYPLAPFAEPWQPLRAMVVLERGTRVRVTPVRGAERLGELVRAGYVSPVESAPTPEWQLLVHDLSARLRIMRLEVPEGLERMHDAWEEIAGALDGI
jgi:hypothetical protein